MLCDECFGKNAEGKLTDENMCPECQDNLDRLCFCCNMQMEKKEDVIEGCCKDCANLPDMFGPPSIEEQKAEEEAWKDTHCGNCSNIDTEAECDCPDPTKAMLISGILD
jgi:hypothetical protein